MFEALFGSKKPAPSPPMPLAPAMARVTQRATAFQHVALDPLLARARLADRLRDAQAALPLPDLFDDLARGASDEAMRRIAVLTSVLGVAPRSRLAAVGGEGVTREVVQMAVGYDLHDMELLRRAPLRAEELVRAIAARLGIAIQGETPSESATRLHQLDLRRLLAEVDLARASAAERLAALAAMHEPEPRRRSKH